MRFDLILRGGEILTPELRERTDVGISGGKIAALGDLGGADTAESVDIPGLTVLPGIIDSHVHFREPGSETKEDLESGTRSAVFGGVTSVCEMPNTNPSTVTREALADKANRAEGRVWANAGFWFGATSENAHELSSLETLPGAAGIKVFMGASTGGLLIPDDPTLREVLKSGKRPVAVHSEDHYRLTERKGLLSSAPSPAEHPFLRDPECARLATERLLRLCEETRRHIHILHVSTEEELPLIRDAKRRGLPVTCEVTPHHLWFAAPDCYDRLGSLVQMNPPVRDERHRLALRRALLEGLFDSVGSDHAPHLLEEKALPYPQSPSGMPGVQTLLPILLTLALDEGLMDPHEAVRQVTSGPANLLGIAGKGRLEPGSDADLTVVDLSRQRFVERNWIQSKCGWSPYEGERLRGFPVHTIVGGAFALRDGALCGTPHGRLLSFPR